jgi:hypothetical protein
MTNHDAVLNLDLLPPIRSEALRKAAHAEGHLNRPPVGGTFMKTTVVPFEHHENSVSPLHHRLLVLRRSFRAQASLERCLPVSMYSATSLTYSERSFGC